MADKSNFLINLSVLYRNTQKYFDRLLTRYDIGSGQLIFLLCINESEGITMQEVTNLTEVDKGTTTKSIQRLIDQGYIQAKTDEKDRRVKRLYTTQKAIDIMNNIYEYRAQLRNTLAQGMDFSAFEEMLSKATDNARDESLFENEVMSLKIGEFQKMSLGDYPDKMACTVYMSGCNYKCPYCNKRDLVFIPENNEFLNPDEVSEYLKKRHQLLDGICFSGGEPLLQEDIDKFIRKQRRLGYDIKIDTNGAYPDRLKALMDKKQVNYVSLDIKNTKEKYAETVGMNADTFNIKPIEETLNILKEGKIEFECKTTVVKELHSKEDLIEIAKWIGPIDHYYLQQFIASDNNIQQGLSAYTMEELEEIKEEIRAFIPSVEIRRVQE